MDYRKLNNSARRNHFLLPFMYQDLKNMFRLPKMKNDAVEFVYSFLTC